MRHALYMAALSVIRQAGIHQRFHQGLRPRSKTGKVALVAVMLKLLLHLNAMAHRGTPWLSQEEWTSEPSIACSRTQILCSRASLTSRGTRARYCRRWVRPGPRSVQRHPAPSRESPLRTRSRPAARRPAPGYRARGPVQQSGKVRNHTSWSQPKRAMATKLSAPQMTTSTGRTGMSVRGCRFVRFTRGSPGCPRSRPRMREAGRPRGGVPAG